MENGVPPHQHKVDRIAEADLIPDGRKFAVVPTWTAAEGTEVTYKSGSIVRRYKMVDGSWRAIAAVNVLSGSGTYDPPSLATGAGQTTTLTVTGAVVGDFVQVSFSLNLQGIRMFAWVSAADTVSVRFENNTGGTIDLASGTIQVRVIPSSQY